jgi:hypothetical protein
LGSFRNFDLCGHLRRQPHASAWGYREQGNSPKLKHGAERV